nr:MAG TPA: hypothetical protein [Caudoviricetes sp.]
MKIFLPLYISVENDAYFIAKITIDFPIVCAYNIDS